MSSVLTAFRRLVSSAAIVFIGTVLGRLLSLFGELLIINSLAPDRFGNVALAYTAVLVLGQVGLLGIPKGVARMESDGAVDRTDVDYLQGGYLLAFSVAVVLGGLLYACRGLISRSMDNEALGPLLVLFIPFVLVFPLGRISVAALRARKQSVGAVVSMDFGPRVGAVMVFGVFLLVGNPLRGAVAYWVVTPVLSTLLALVFLARTIPVGTLLGAMPSIERIGELLGFSLPLAIATTLITLMTSFDVIMIGFFLDPTSVGFYRSVQPLRQITHFVLQSFVFMFLPLATEFHSAGQRDKLRELYRVSSKWVALLTLPLVLVFSLFSADIIRVLLQDQYLPGATALSVLTAGLFFNAVVGPNGSVIQAINEPRIEMYAAVLGVATNLLLNVVLIPAIGIVGAAIATVVGYIVFNTAEVTAIYLLLDVHPFSANSLLPIVLTTLVGGGVAWMARDLSPGIPTLLGVGILIIIVEVVVIVVTGSLDEFDRELLDEAKSRIH